MSSSSFLSRFSPVGVGALVLLPLAVWACAHFWWFNVGETELCDLDVYCGLMPLLLAVMAACFCLFMLPPWRASQRGARAWWRRAAAFVVLAAGGFLADGMACCCCVGYCEWAVLLPPLAVLGIIACLIAAVVAACK